MKDVDKMSKRELRSEVRRSRPILAACKVKLKKLFDATGGVYHGGIEHSQLIKLIDSVLADTQ